MSKNHIFVQGNGKVIGNIYQGVGGGHGRTETGHSSQNDIAEESFDVALSYASEQETYVNRVSKILKKEGKEVFFAPDCENLYKAQDMYQKFYEIYRYKSRYIACFVSKEYLQKDYTMHEYECACLKSKDVGENRIVVINFDGSSLPHFDSDINYIDAQKSREVQTADFILKILNQ